MKILVTGGAGYIGSFMTKRLLDESFSVVVLDNLSFGHKDLLDRRAELVVGDITDKPFLNNFFKNNSFDGVIHFAGLISMAESVRKPQLYFQVNTNGTENLVNEMVKNNINNLVFSSTAGVYGNAEKIPIPESSPTIPTNPYGESKLKSERYLLEQYKRSNLYSVSLRYFNASGASEDSSLGEMHNPETHIIPNIIESLLHDKEFILYGDDYDTSDGTCIRDYIHVNDLVEAHVLALKRIWEQPGSYVYNVGIGVGHSNKEIIREAEKISGKKVKVKIDKRRAGDAKILIADPTKIKTELKFLPKYSDLSIIVKTAWDWHVRNSKFKILASIQRSGQNAK